MNTPPLLFFRTKLPAPSRNKFSSALNSIRPLLSMSTSEFLNHNESMENFPSFTIYKSESSRDAESILKLLLLPDKTNVLFESLFICKHEPANANPLNTRFALDPFKFSTVTVASFFANAPIGLTPPNPVTVSINPPPELTSFALDIAPSANTETAERPTDVISPPGTQSWPPVNFITPSPELTSSNVPLSVAPAVIPSINIEP